MDKAKFLHICQKLENFPPQQQNVCKFLLNRYEEVAFLTVEQLAEAVDVSPATVVRTITRMGYSSFQVLKEEITHLLISTKPPTRRQLEDSWAEPIDENILIRVAKKNASDIHSMLTPYLLDNFEKASELLLTAHTMKIMGQRSSKSAAIYFYLLLREFIPSVSLIGNFGTDSMYEELIDLGEEDAFFAISYGSPLYAKRTIDAVKYLHDRKVPIILLTDSLKNPAVPFSSVVLLVSFSAHNYTLVPVMTVLDAFITQLGRQKPDESKHRLRDLWRTIVDSDIMVSTPELQEEMDRKRDGEWSTK